MITEMNFFELLQLKKRLDLLEKRLNALEYNLYGEKMLSGEDILNMPKIRLYHKKSKDGRWIITKFEMVWIKPIEYYNKILEEEQEENEAEL